MFSPEKRACWQALQRQAITLTPQEKVQGGDMPGDTVRITAPVCRRVEKLLPHLAAKLEENTGNTSLRNSLSQSAAGPAPARPVGPSLCGRPWPRSA